MNHELINTHIGRRLRRLRRSRRFSQNHLGDLCGVSFQQIQKYECGESQMPARRLWQIATVLGVSCSYFFEGLEEGSSQPQRLKAGE